MTLDKSYFEYRHRRRGLDHDRFEHRNLPTMRPVVWPGCARVALWVTVHLDFFPLDMGRKPIRVSGGMERPYPDYWDYTLRDYGNRIGVVRVMRVLDSFGVKANAAFNSDLAVRYPTLLDAVVEKGWEVMASGVSMGQLHHGGLAIDEERALVAKSVRTLRSLSNQPVLGWHSPAHSESSATLDLIASEGLSYVADWINDDMPFPMRTTNATLYSMPLSHELSDLTILWQKSQSSVDYVDQVLAAFNVLYAEAEERGGRILSLPVHPWITGQPHRIPAFRGLLKTIISRRGVWPATGAQILAATRAQSDDVLG